MYPANLPAEWREKGKGLRRFSEGAAAAFKECADDLDQAWRIWQEEPLTLDEAAEESGYTYSSLQQKVAAGEIPNIGDKGRPRVRRADLPRKTPKSGFKLETGEPDLAAEILADKL